MFAEVSRPRLSQPHCCPPRSPNPVSAVSCPSFTCMVHHLLGRLNFLKQQKLHLFLLSKFLAIFARLLCSWDITRYYRQPKGAPGSGGRGETSFKQSPAMASQSSFACKVRAGGWKSLWGVQEQQLPGSSSWSSEWAPEGSLERGKRKWSLSLAPVLAILAMSSRRRSQTFLQDTVSRGAEFVKTLRLFYPQADTLCEKDFDWLFDCPETEQFIMWFCKTVGEENVLSPAEVQAYDALVAAGKPILEGDALEQVLQKCQKTPQLSRVIPEAEGSSLEALEQEVQELEGYRAHQLWRLNKLQVWAASLQQELRYLEEEEKATKEVLRKAHVELRVEIFRTTAVLKQLIEVSKQQVEQLEEARKGQPPALLHEMDLRGYIELEQQFTDACEHLMEQVLPGSAQAPESSAQERLEAAIQMDSASEILGGRAAPHPEYAETGQGAAAESQEIKVQGSRAESPVEGRSESEELSVGDVEEKGGSQDASERMDTKQKRLKSLRTNGDEILGNQDNFWMELSQLETAYICAQMEVIAMSAKVEGNCAALNWAQKTLQALKENKHVAEAKLQSHAATFKQQLYTLRCDIAQIQTHQLLPQVKAAASLFLLPVLQEKLCLDSARLQDIGRRQEEATAWVVSQQSRLDLLELQLKRERKELDQKAAWLGELETTLKNAQAKLQAYHDCCKEASSSMKGSACTQMEPKDSIAMRLWDVLMGQDQDEQQSYSYKAIAACSSQLVQEQRELEAQLAAPISQHTDLESTIEELYWQLYNDSKQLQLCSPEIAELMHQLITMQDVLHHNLTELLNDLKQQLCPPAVAETVSEARLDPEHLFGALHC
uniref:HAUS augmin-like complex subunit 3 N-terminal domain-containing protein n=1 Tax=Pavo cristatus TaxID=9049 RepID=A0A8C9FK21_PAVCR